MKRILETILAVVVVIFVGLSLGASDVRADAFVITGGSAHVMNAQGGPFHLLGDDVELNGGMNWGPGAGPFRAGETAHISTLNTGGDLRNGSGVVNGVFYAPRLFYEGWLQFDSSFVVPNISSPSMFVIDTPFTLVNDPYLRACLNSEFSGPCLPGNLVFSAGLVGQGTAHVTMSSGLGGPPAGSGRLFQVQTVDYEFFAPVPEPSTWLLTGTVLVLLAWRYRVPGGMGSCVP